MTDPVKSVSRKMYDESGDDENCSDYYQGLAKMRHTGFLNYKFKGKSTGFNRTSV